MAEWLEADYFDAFQCKCGDCRSTCCRGWEIAVSMKDYYHMIGMECSENLHAHIERAFRTPEFPTPERFKMISPNWLGDCPLHDESGLCMLHRECGDAHLPAICRLYPRSVRLEGQTRRACCSNSCEAVIETLMRQDRLTILRRERDLEIGITETDPRIDLTRTWRAIDRIQKRGEPVADRICAICRDQGAEGISSAAPDAALRMQLAAMDRLRGLSKSLTGVGEAAFERYIGETGYANYLQDIAAFEGAWPDWARIFENVITNHIMYMDFPYVDPRVAPKEACAGLCAAYGAMRVICAAHTRDDCGFEALADALAGVFHVIEHSAFYYNARILLAEYAASLKL